MLPETFSRSIGATTRIGLLTSPLRSRRYHPPPGVLCAGSTPRAKSSGGSPPKTYSTAPVHGRRCLQRRDRNLQQQRAGHAAALLNRLLETGARLRAGAGAGAHHVLECGACAGLKMLASGRARLRRGRSRLWRTNIGRRDRRRAGWARTRSPRRSAKKKDAIEDIYEPFLIQIDSGSHAAAGWRRRARIGYFGLMAPSSHQP